MDASRKWASQFLLRIVCFFGVGVFSGPGPLGPGPRPGSGWDPGGWAANALAAGCQIMAGATVWPRNMVAPVTDSGVTAHAPTGFAEQVKSDYNCYKLFGVDVFLDRWACVKKSISK